MSYRLILEAACLGWLFLAPLSGRAAGETNPVLRFTFREPHPVRYRIEPFSLRVSKQGTGMVQSVKAFPDNGSTNGVELTSRVVLQLHKPGDPGSLLTGESLTLSRTLNPRTFILQAPDVWTALAAAARLSQKPEVAACYPVKRRPLKLFNEYAPRPNDPFFFRAGQSADRWQANLEDRDTNGVSQGVDLNVRAAWPISEGQGVTIALGDDGVELDHPDLVDRTRGAPHFNFVDSLADGSPSGAFSYHATAVAGLAAATAGNSVGVAGVAPKASVASWVIFDSSDNLASEEALMDMFQYQSNVVSVQNHSWGKIGSEQLRLSTLEDMAISNAVTSGRSGRGVVIVRAAGNGREDGNDANEDGYLADPRAIGVAAVRQDGRVTRYSTPGACVLVAAPSGDVSSDQNPCFPDSPNLVTTDRQGSGGYNQDTSSFGGGDYTFGLNGFSGTSGATPQISGLVALLLSANPNLGYRDVQQILILSSRHFDFKDPTLVTNGAGFLVSHNLGFGVPDAGVAVRLATTWSNRPRVTNVIYSATQPAAVPDLGFRLHLQADGLPASLSSLALLPGGGPHPVGDTAAFPLVDVGSASAPITEDLTGKVALIQRGGNYFCEKLNFAAQAGAAMAVVYNNTNGDNRIIMAGTDLAPIPSAFLSQNDGEALRQFLVGGATTLAQFTFASTNYTFDVQEALQCEFVGVRLNSDHTARGDLRIVLTSPSGTRSVLQRVNQDSLPGPSDWTYWTVQDFFESSYGRWTLSIADEDDKGTGSILSASLVIRGVPIRDTDHDGLDDAWELAHFQTLAYGPSDDPDHDGYSNAREQLMGTDPAAIETPFRLDISRWDGRLARLSWPSRTNIVYRLQAGSETIAPLALTTNLPGRFPESECFVPYTDLVHEFFRLEAVPGQ